MNGFAVSRFAVSVASPFLWLKPFYASLFEWLTPFIAALFQWLTPFIATLFQWLRRLNACGVSVAYAVYRCAV
ncbi:MAG: hypothetical protein II554_01605 [Bacteroidales bacterium]|nr:hypothetical protein [Bacteroidales bacterium]MBQ2542019.1 hypothetical protein [Bacteroidales bacterium]